MDKRRYSAALRNEQTALTRRRILEAAGRLFAEQGYLGTTLAGVAKEAAVSVQTVYNVVGGKSVLLKAVYDMTLAGDDEPVPMVQRPIFRAMIEAPTGRECLGHYAAIARLLSERIQPLVSMTLAQAATGDPDLREFADAIEGERAIGTGNLARHPRGALRPTGRARRPVGRGRALDPDRPRDRAAPRREPRLVLGQIRALVRHDRGRGSARTGGDCVAGDGTVPATDHPNSRGFTDPGRPNAS